MNKEDIKAIASVKDMFSEVTMKDIDEQKITIYGAAMLDVIRVLTIVEKQHEKIKRLKDHNISQSKIILNMSERHFHDREKIRKYEALQDKIKERIKMLEETRTIIPPDNNYTYMELIDYGIEELKDLIKN